MKKTVLLLFLSFPLILFSQQHPLPVESASLLEAGHAQFDFTAAYFHDQTYPLSGLTGDLTKFGTIRIAVSLSEFVELQTDGTLLNILRINDRKPAFNSTRTISANPTSDIGDFSFWTKFAVLNEYSTGIGFSVRFGIQLPNASNESGLGIDEMNFHSSLLFQKHFAGKWTINTGLGILGDPTVAGQQHDVFIYGIEYTLPIGETTYLLLQYAGRRGHEGTGIYHLDNAKVGLEYEIGDLSLSAAAVTNFSAEDKSKGIELTASYLFQFIDLRRQ
ncbi:MAG: hypothetical protein ACOYNS_12660 [Bacteroidota bacterium]